MLTKESTLGKCTACGKIGKCGYCCSCTDVSSDGFAEQPCFEELDLDSVHLDTMGDHFTDDEDYIVDVNEIVIPTLMKPQGTAATYGPPTGGNLYPTKYKDIFTMMLLDIVAFG
jgi:hypothetical protein